MQQFGGSARSDEYLGHESEGSLSFCCAAENCLHSLVKTNLKGFYHRLHHLHGQTFSKYDNEPVFRPLHPPLCCCG